MKRGTTDYIQDIINRVLANNNLKFAVLLSLVYFISPTLTAQEVALEAKNIRKVDQPAGFDPPALQHLFLKVQINPPHNSRLIDYTGLPINILSNSGELIASGALDQNGQITFDKLTKVSLKRIQIFSIATSDKIIVENPKGAVVGFSVSAPDKKDI